jgi:glyoxylase-like metal-dependent hydrolase (beta-lactamase superfamily II)
MVDDEFAPLSDKIKARIAELGGGPVRFLVNTHWHGDHTGGNENFAADATIIAHENLRRSLADPAAKRVPAALPTLTYTDHLNLHYNGEEVRVIHLPAGHTDGDSAVWFTGSKVIHLGDEYTNRNFPFIDIGSGGTLVGLVQNAEQLLAMLPDDITIVPGHGPLSTKADYALWVDGVKATAEIVMTKMAAGEDLQTIIDEGLPAEYESWGRGFITESAWITGIYNSTAGQN